MRRRAVAIAAAVAVALVAAGCSSSSSSTTTHHLPPASPTPTPSAGRVVPIDAAVRTAAGKQAAALSIPLVDPDYPAHGTTSIDALHYGLDLWWNATSHVLKGTAAIRFRATRDESGVALDFAVPLAADSVTIDGRQVSWTHPGAKLDIDTGPLVANTIHTLVIGYGGEPHPTAAPTTRKDIPDLGWTVQPDGEAWSVQEPYGAFTWYPVNDHPSDKAYYDITWHTKAAWRGVSNGRLVSQSVSHGVRTMRWHLASPAASYLITVGIGPYHEYRQTGPHGLPLTYWIRPRDVASVLPKLRESPRLLRWLEARLGRYPFDRLGDLVEPGETGEETQTLVTIGPGVMRHEPKSLPDLLHEYSHQWYGDEVTPNNWKDLWLNESFAMFFQIEWSIHTHLESARQWHHVLNAQDQRLRNQFGPPGEYYPNQFASTNVYFCGARMLFRLRSMLGAKTFNQVIRGWPAQHRYGTADRAEWIAYLDRVSGRNLGPFVTRWLTAKISPR